MSVDALKEALKNPVFQGVDLGPAIQNKMRTVTYPAEQAFCHEGDPGDALYVVVSGEVAIYRDDQLAQFVAAPAILGLLSVVDGEPRTATLKAFVDSDVVILKKSEFDTLMHQSPQFVTNVTEHLARRLRHMTAVEAEHLRSNQAFFESPNARLVPGPYFADPFEMIALVMETDSDSLKGLLPRGLRLIPGLSGRYLLTFNFFPRVYSGHHDADHQEYKYNETTPFIPCMGPNLRPGVYCPEIYPDNMLAIAIGRELYGFPKRYGKTTRHSSGVDLSVGNSVILRSSWRDRQSASFSDFVHTMQTAFLGGFGVPQNYRDRANQVLDALNTATARKVWPAVPVYLHKQIPDVASEFERVYAIDELVEVPFHVTDITDFSTLERPRVRFFSKDFFLGGRCIGGGALRLAFRFGKGRRRIDYRKGPIARLLT